MPPRRPLSSGARKPILTTLSCAKLAFGMLTTVVAAVLAAPVSKVRLFSVMPDGFIAVSSALRSGK